MAVSCLSISMILGKLNYRFREKRTFASRAPEVVVEVTTAKCCRMAANDARYVVV